ncbi:hypothetical protein [Pseudoflavonifractor sp. MSJ-37]|uniref:hypothetical protein n=1 Tax=Pseudoflavonifractor sp. MSJ-37 TaxID=2841531 RepID=UPI001C109F90|nr:hypothetical protein [Pseudoflavonifractor sp. MSJ-37]MBU5435616.1 hypothetical protein [Pseudoflavonifractor sp. MSJ-37]
MVLSFSEIKEEYVQRREQERKDLIAYLQRHDKFLNSGLTVVTRGGSGNRDYSSGKKISPFDLRNWKWVECKSPDNRFHAIISLNMPETDMVSGNAHALYDRIGLVVLYQSGKDYYKTMILTDIDLPFGENEKGEKAKEKIARIVIEQFEIYNRRTR